jgi:hypothetical protein
VIERSKHDTQVLAELCARIRRAPRPLEGPGVSSSRVHELPRAELIAAYDAGILELDREATARLDLSPAVPDGVPLGDG